MFVVTISLFLLLAEVAAPNEVAEAPCPVTVQPAAPFLPPCPYPEKPPWSSMFWVGNKKLWTMIPGGGAWKLSRGEMRQKLFWFREGYDPEVEPRPGLKISARRLDASAPPLVADDATSGTSLDLGSFMLTGINFRSAGCWEVTGKYKGQELGYVVRVTEAP